MVTCHLYFKKKAASLPKLLHDVGQYIDERATAAILRRTTNKLH